MPTVTRRQFVQWGTATLTASVLGGLAAGRARAAEARKMTIDLCCGRIGVPANQAETIAYAGRYGFESAEPLVGALARASAAELQGYLQQLESQRLVWGAAGLPVDFRQDDQRFAQGLEELKAAAPALERAGVTRLGTWISPAHDELTYLANFRRHARRLGEVARVMQDHQLRLGLEYVGPKTSWAARRHPFIHTMAETQELIAEIGLDNVGLVLDSWHWYTAHETREHLKTLTNRDIVAVDLNDAPAGRAVDEQIDSQRELPMATGVIDVATFLNTLNELGCDAPVRAEPFNAELRKLPPDEAVAATAAAMQKAFALIGS